MPSTFLRGLELLRVVDELGPIGVSQLARVLGADKASVSRMVSAAELDGWVSRIDGAVVVGPRSALLGGSSPTGEAMRLGEPLVHALAGVTGLLCQAVSLVGRVTAPILSVDNGPSGSIQRGLHARLPVWAGAAPKVIGAQLPVELLDELLPDDPLPSPRTLLGTLGLVDDAQLLRLRSTTLDEAETTIARSRAGLEEQYASIRSTGLFYERGELDAELACVSVPWPVGRQPAALALVGSRAAIERSYDLALRCLLAAARPGAIREDVVAAAG